MPGVHVYVCCATEIRNAFPSHLCARLREAGARVVNGAEDLPKGVNLRDAIRCAIKDSSFSVVVLSREFASSPFRLDELVHIMESSTHACLPVFFHISPDHDCASLIRDSGSSSSSCFIDSLNDHKMEFTWQRVQSWIKALARIAAIAGWPVHASRSEAEVVEEIVETIFPNN